MNDTNLMAHLEKRIADLEQSQGADYSPVLLHDLELKVKQLTTKLEELQKQPAPEKGITRQQVEDIAKKAGHSQALAVSEMVINQLLDEVTGRDDRLEKTLTQKLNGSAIEASQSANKAALVVEDIARQASATLLSAVHYHAYAESGESK